MTVPPVLASGKEQGGSSRCGLSGLHGVMHVRAGREGNCRAIAVGAGRTLDPDWMKGRPGGWENELLVAYLLPTGHVAAYSVPLVGGAFLWDGRVYR
jgi:hypothetical protein